MTALEWGKGHRLYDQGLDQGVLYGEGPGVAWDGLVSVDEQDTGEIDTEHYYDGRRIHISHQSGHYKASLRAYTYPDELETFIEGHSGLSQKRFGLSYRSHHEDHWRIHLVYNVALSVGDRAFTTDSDQSNPSLFGWEISGTDVDIPGATPASHLIVDSLLTEEDLSNGPGLLDELQDILYGTETTDPRLPSPTEVVTLYGAYSVFKVTYHGDGTYSITAPDSMLTVNADGSFVAQSPTVFPIDPNTFIASSG